MIKTNFAVLMAERGLKIADVYEETGISKTTLMALADNTGKGVQFDTVDKLCNYFGVEIKDFFVYVPYIWEISFKKMPKNNSDYIVVNLKTKNSIKDYLLTVWRNHPENYDLPIENNNFKLWLSTDLQDSDAYDDDDFYNFLINLPVSMTTLFYNQIIEMIKNNLLKHDTVVTVYCDDFGKKKNGLQDTITLKKGDKIYLSLFDGTYNAKAKLLETTKIITI